MTLVVTTDESACAARPMRVLIDIDLQRHLVQNFRIDAKALIAGQRLTAELQQYPLVFPFNAVGLTHIRPLFGLGAILQDIRAAP